MSFRIRDQLRKEKQKDLIPMVVMLLIGAGAGAFLTYFICT